MQNKAMSSEFAQSIAKEDIYAGFFTRLAAYLIDSLFLFVCLAFPRFIVWIMNLSSPDNLLAREILFSFSLWNILEYLLCTGYFVVLTYLSGMTLGKKAMRIRVVTKDGEKPSLFTVIYRETIGKYLSALILYVGYLLIGLDKEKRGLHDILCDTRVIYSCKMVEYKQQQTVYTPVQPFVPTMPQGQNPIPPGNGNSVPTNPFYQAPSQGMPNNRPAAPFYQPPFQNPPVIPNAAPPIPPQTTPVQTPVPPAGALQNAAEDKVDGETETTPKDTGV